MPEVYTATSSLLPLSIAYEVQAVENLRHLSNLGIDGWSGASSRVGVSESVEH